MKRVDDINAKYELWALNPVVPPLPRATGIPPFGSRKFDSYEAFNAWKRGLLEQIAAQGGVTWTK